MLPPKEVQALRSPFPEEAIQIYNIIRDESKTTILIGYKPQYIIERLNDCFGHDGWDFEIIKYDIVDGYAWVLGRLTIYLSKIMPPDDIMGEPLKRSKVCSKEQFGTSKIGKMTGVGDALKGAATNAMEKCASMLDIGHDAYKGKVKASAELLKQYNIKPEDINGKTIEKSKIEELRAELKQVCIDNNITTKSALNAAIKNILKKSITIDELSDFEDFEKIISHIKTHKAPF